MKVKICKVDGCNNEAIIFPNSTIKGKFCREHAISQALTKVRSNTIKTARKVKTEKTVALMSCDEYRSKYVQPIINEIARLIDYGQPCIATGKLTGKQNGGHYHAVGSNRTLALNLHNIHVQSFESNHFKSGDNLLYKEGLIKVYGLDYFKLIESLNQIQPIKLAKYELIEIKRIASAIRNELKKELKVRSAKERIQMRENINSELGIYQSLY